MIDNVRCGDHYSADYLRTTGLVNSPTFARLFTLIAACDVSAQADGVKNTGETDSSLVYVVGSLNSKRFYFTAEYNANQTDTKLIEAPGAGRQIIIEYASISTDANSGEGSIHSDTNAVYKLYIDNQQSSQANQLYIPIGEGKDVLFTSTQGTKKIFVTIQYRTEVA